MTPPESQVKPIGWAIVAAASAAAIFTLDLLTPLGIAVSMLYVLPLVTTWFVPGWWSTGFMTGIVLVLTWVGGVLSPGTLTSDALTNRSLAAILLLTVGALIVRQKVLVQQTEAVHEALRKSEVRYRTIFGQAGAGVAQIDSRTGQFLKVNRKYCEIVDFTEDEMLATTFMHITHPDDLAEDIASMERLLNGESSSFTMEKRYVRKDGSIVWVNLNVAPLWQAGEMPSQHIAVVQEITARKHAEESLRKAQELLQETEKIGHVGGWEFDIDTRKQIWTDEVYRIHEVSRDFEPTTDNGIAFYTPESKPTIERVVQRAIETGEPFDVELEFITAKGNRRWVHAIGERDLEGRRVHGFFQDITARKQAEEALRTLNAALEERVKERTRALAEANERWGWVVRATNDGVWDWDLLHDSVYFSPRWKEMHGLQIGDETESASQWSERIHPEDRPRVLKHLQEYLAGSCQKFWEEYRIQRKDGTYFWVLDRGVALWDEQGRAVRIVGAETDMTWRKEAEERLRRREHEFSTLADNVPALFSYINRDRRYRFVNARYEELFGRPNEKIVGMSVGDLLGPDGYAHVEPYLDKALGGEAVSFEYELKIPGDGTHYLSAQYVPDWDEQGQVAGLFALLTDITALKLSESVLREREGQLQALSAKLLKVQEEERRRIAQDLHDDVTQRLAALTLELHGISQTEAKRDPQLASRMKVLGTSAERLTTDVQKMAHQLHPSILEHVGLEAAVREQVDEFAARTGLTVEVLTREVPKNIPRDHATCLYRVLQESLQNVRKHANATSVLVRLLPTSGGVGLHVCDDGGGFEHAESAAGRKGLGLTSMAERVSALKGTFRVRTKRGEGTEIDAWVPLEDANRET